MTGLVLVAGAAATLDLIASATGDSSHGHVARLEAGPAVDGRWLAGGAAPTVALAAAAAGASVAVWHPRPATPFDPAFRNLILAGIDVSRSPVTPGQARCIVLRSRVGTDLWSSVPPEPEPGSEVLDGIDHLVVAPRWGTWTETLLDAARGRGIKSSAVGLAPQPGRRWTIVVASEEQLDPRSARAVDAEVLVLTRGPRGAIIRLGDEWLEVAAAPAEVVDPVGAGDVFAGTLIGCLERGVPLRAAAEAASQAAARCCERWGAQTSLAHPDRQAASKQRDRLEGALAGLACGDAFGMPASFLPPAVLPDLWPTGIDRMVPAPPSSPYHAGYPAGRATDDTEQAIALTRALTRSPHPLDPEIVAQELDVWLESVGGADSLAVGPSTKRGLAAWRAGTPVRESGRSGTSNGGSMRITPVGALHGLLADQSDELLRDVVAACLPTHNTGTAIAGAAAVAGAVAAGIRGRAWTDVLAGGIEMARRAADEGNWVYAPDVADRIELGLAIAAEAEDDQSFSARVSRVLGTGEPTAEAVPAAFAIAARAEGEPAVALVLAASTPGDTDTIGAMAGAICGSWAGRDRLPEAWRALVERENGISFAAWADDLLAVAQR